MSGRAYNEIFEIAADQYGFVTTAQAKAEGVASQSLVMMARRGALIAVSRGVYRLAQFPQTEFDQYMEAALWPFPAQGALSHETALDLFGISDVNPACIHVSVSEAYRSRRTVPRHIALHRMTCGEEDLVVHRGLPMTSVERTIVDCQQASVGPAIIRQAVDGAERQGLLGPQTAARLRECL